MVGKPTRNLAGGTAAMLAELRTKVMIAATAKLQKAAVIASPSHRPRALASTTHKLVAIGASTGGTEALRGVLAQLPPTFPGTVVVQHMPAGFTAAFAQRLDEACRVEVREATDGDRIFPGRVLIAPAGQHLRVQRSGGDFVANVAAGDKVSGHCPSADVLFQSVARAAGRNAVGLLLTGMGSDSADGLLAMRASGARTLAQDEATSVVWGMPRAAWERGAAEALVALPNVPDRLCDLVEDLCSA
ncbi:MAG: chemotaxis protein CheB [Myxococcota bacterium]